jgi:hypothetical protein
MGKKWKCILASYDFIVSIIMRSKEPIASRLDDHHHSGFQALRSSCASCICSQNTKFGPKEESYTRTSSSPLPSTRNIMPYASHDLEFDHDFIEQGQVYSLDQHFHDADNKYVLNRYSIDDVDLRDLMQTMKPDVSCEKGVKLFHLFSGTNDS